MNYAIHITSKAERDLNEAADYIEFTLLNPQAADGLLDKTEEEINKLSSEINTAEKQKADLENDITKANAKVEAIQVEVDNYKRLSE